MAYEDSSDTGAGGGPTAAEEAAAQAYFADYFTSHQLPSNFPNVEAAMNHYRGARGQGQSHEQAMNETPGVLAWTSYTPTPTAQPGPAPTPTPTGPAGPAAPKTYTYEEMLAYANQQAQSLWGRGLSAADITNMKGALGFNPGAPIQGSAQGAITGWLTANKPKPTTGGPGAPPPTTPGGLVPPDGSYGAPPPGSPGFGGFPDYQRPEPFQSQEFRAPTAADILSDPSYNFRFDQGQHALEANKAAKGVMNGGGTAKALLEYGQDFGSQEYKNIWDRDLTAHNSNEDRRFQAYASNVLTQTNQPYENAYRKATDTNQNAQTSYQDNYQNWLGSYNAWRNSRNDAFDQKFRVAQG